MLNAERKCSPSNTAGIAPVRLFSDKSRLCRFVRLPNCSGICPVKSLKLRLSPFMAFNRPISMGISPVNLLLLRSSTLGKAMGTRY
ncbi:unnamed protein product [Alopecurus aequalis]